MENSSLVLLGQIYRAEILATRSVADIIDRCNHQKTMFYLDRLLAIHVANQHQIRDICRALRYSPSDELEVPPRIEKLMTKKNVPERLMLSWLTQCESRLSDLYGEIGLSTLPEGLSKKFNTVKDRQHSMLAELNILSLDSTEVLDLALWES
jgi:hypothetical protein